MFEAGQRGPSDQPGSGLGLAIVQRSMELFGGRAEILEGPRGRGTTVRLTLRPRPEPARSELTRPSGPGRRAVSDSPGTLYG